LVGEEAQVISPVLVKHSIRRIAVVPRIVRERPTKGGVSYGASDEG
jgi:hypothetical protein